MLSWIIVLSWRNQLKPSRIHEVHEVALKHEMITFLFQDPFCPAHIYMDAPEYSVIWISLCHLDNLAVIFLHLFILVLLKFQCFSFSFSAKSFATPPQKKQTNLWTDCLPTALFLFTHLKQHIQKILCQICLFLQTSGYFFNDEELHILHREECKLEQLLYMKKERPCLNQGRGLWVHLSPS